MIDHDEAEQVLQVKGRLYLGDGTDAGPVRRIFLDEYSGWPGFCTIGPRPSLSPVSGAAGREVFVALHTAELVEGGLRVPYDATTIDNAPHVLDGQSLTIAEEDALFEYYEMPVDPVTSDS